MLTFSQELSGVFQMRIYDQDFMVKRLIEDCSIQPGDPLSHHRRVVAGIDLDKLNERLQMIPVKEIRQRRQNMNFFYQETLLSSDPRRGINFTSCLMILAHYNVISDAKNLRLEEFLQRRARLQRVHETIRRNVVIGWFDMMRQSKRFRRIMAARKGSDHKSVLTGPPQISVPEIFVENPHDSLDSSIGAEGYDFTESTPLRPLHHDGGQGSSRLDARTLPKIETSFSPRSPARAGKMSFDASPGASPTLSSNRLQSLDTPHHAASRMSPTTPTLGEGHSRHGSSVSAISTQGVMESFDLSAWGESLRRSFTMRRPSQ